MTKKPKTVWEGDIEVTPITAKERRALDKKVKKRYERLCNRYKEIRGKRVDWISHNYEEGLLYVGVRFTDGAGKSSSCLIKASWAFLLAPDGLSMTTYWPIARHKGLGALRKPVNE